MLLIGSSNNSIEVRLKPDPNDSVPLFGFTLHYKAAFGEWETVQVPKKVRRGRGETGGVEAWLGYPGAACVAVSEWLPSRLL